MTRLDEGRSIYRRIRIVRGGRSVDYVVQLTAAGLAFREPRRRSWVVAPLSLVVSMAERLAGDAAFRESRERRMRRVGKVRP